MLFALPDFQTTKGLTKPELLQKINESIAQHNTSGGLDVKPFMNAQFYMNELVTRQQDEQTKVMICMTKIIVWLTVIITAFTILNLILAWKVYKLSDLMYQLMQQPPH